jgi:hypothetical protein
VLPAVNRNLLSLKVQADHQSGPHIVVQMTVVSVPNAGTSKLLAYVFVQEWVKSMFQLEDPYEELL